MNESKLEVEIDGKWQELKKIGENTWRLFWWQIGTFAAGVLLFVLGVAVSVSEKLH